MRACARSDPSDGGDDQHGRPEEEPLRQLAATGSPTNFRANAQAILDSAVESAARLCEADVAQVWLVADDGLQPAAASGPLSNNEYRTVLVQPLMRDAMSLGTFSLSRLEERPFTEREIELLQVLADQLTSALEVGRLQAELEARDGELDQVLQQQAATTEVLRAMSRSGSATQAVFETILEEACRLCGAATGVLYRVDDGLARPAVIRGGSAELLRVVQNNPIPPSRRTVAGRVALERRTVHVPDVLADSEYDYPAQEVEGYRTLLGVPIVRGNAVLGSIVIWRTEVRPFTNHQIEVVETFASQAGIALENLRLLGDVEARTHELSTALEQKTATAEILSAAAASASDLQAVLDAVAQRAARLGGAPYVDIRRFENGRLRKISSYSGVSDEPLEAGELDAPGTGILATRESLAGRALLEQRTIHVHDLAGVVQSEYPESGELQQHWGYRTNLAIPLLHDDTPLGVLSLKRFEVRPFSEQDIQLLETFAHAAALAISSAGLLHDLRERTSDLARSVQELEALGEIGRAVSSSLDLQQVLTSIVAHATGLSGTDGGVVYQYDKASREFRLCASHQCTPELVEVLQVAPVVLGEGAIGRAAVDGRPLQISDVLDEAAYPVRLREALGRAGFRALLAVPFMADDVILGGLVVARKTPGVFPDRVLELVQTFATQSALAIQNAGLFHEIEARRADLERLYQFSTDVQQPLSFKERLQLILRAVQEVLSFDRAAIWLPTPDERFLEATAWTGMHPGENEVVRVPLDGSIPILNKVYREQMEIILDGSTPVPSEYRVAPAYADLEQVRSRNPTAVPLISRGKCVGVLGADNKRSRDSASPNLELLRIFAASAAVTIENAQLLDTAQQELAERRRVEEELRSSETLHRTLLDSADDVIDVKDAEGRYVVVNSAMAQRLGQAKDEIVGKLPTDLYPGEIGSRIRADDARVLSDGIVVDAEEVHPNGIFHVRRVPLRDAVGTVIGVVTISRDITERKQVEQEIQHKTRLVALLEQVAVAANEAVAVEGALQIGLAQVCAYIGWPVGHVFLVDRSATGARLVSSELWHLDNPEHFARFRAMTAATRLEPGADLPGRVLASGKPVWVADVTRDGTFVRGVNGPDLGVRAGFAFPVLVAGTEVAAVLEFFSPAEAEPDKALLEVTSLVATQLARVFERERSDERLRQATEVAEAADQAKSAFLASMSHELRTPLNAILGYAELLKEEVEDAGLDQLTPDLRRIHGAGVYLLGVINDILDLSKIEAGKIDLFLEDVDVTVLIREVAGVVQPLIDQNRNVLEVNCSVGPAEMRVDLIKLRQILLNLLSNAAKFTARGVITLTADRETQDGGEWWTFSVRDTGIGLTSEQLERIFEVFSQADASTTRTYGGTGLGLAISRRFCRLMGGDLSVQSEPGRGSTFTVTLPDGG